MNTLKKHLPGLVIVLLLATGLVVLLTRIGSPAAPQETSPNAQTAPVSKRAARVHAKSTAAHGTPAGKTEKSEEDDAATTEADDDTDTNIEIDSDADDEEALVNAFDDLTESWREPAAERVTLDAVKTFHARFMRVPATRREECLQRALNLIPDENVMLLAGILLDTSLDADTLDLVYNDVLNRSEDVKKPLLQEIYKNKNHPNWAATAWILDVTGELPQNGATR